MSQDDPRGLFAVAEAVEHDDTADYDHEAEDEASLLSVDAYVPGDDDVIDAHTMRDIFGED